MNRYRSIIVIGLAHCKSNSRLSMIACSRLISAALVTTFYLAAGSYAIILLKLGLTGYSSFAASRTEHVASRFLSGAFRLECVRAARYRSAMLTAQ